MDFREAFSKPSVRILLFGAVHDPRVNGSIRFCHNILPMIDNLITDNLIINITSLSITVKEKSSLDKLAFSWYI